MYAWEQVFKTVNAIVKVTLLIVKEIVVEKTLLTNAVSVTDLVFQKVNVLVMEKNSINVVSVTDPVLYSHSVTVKDKEKIVMVSAVVKTVLMFVVSVMDRASKKVNVIVKVM